MRIGRKGGQRAAWVDDIGRIGLAETIEALRAELAEAEKKGQGDDVRFRVGPISLEFHVGVQREGGVEGKLRFWVVELGATGRYTTESIQKISVTLNPVRDDGTVVELSDTF